ncbi:YdiU family protein [Rhodophyticola sp. CCM32]|uniref:protein adenylyltransferase SelO n=1 Tax=Rhodophyticola sp. CCM32 TaxID=2916397 RepID=UPI00107FA8CA|nr:YdiU family protein [Rhodophyticola sp. CCM32]QBY00740.1 YdiU family protein [Rhodophyticola sp. CCM32]
MTVQIPFDNSYARLPDRFFTAQPPTPVAAPGLITVNRPLAAELGITLPNDDTGIAAIFAGNTLPDGATPLAQVYAGHQFGGWAPQLGDGRAVLLGEVVDRAGQRRDIQLKGAGPTPYSRMGDGRAWLGPVLREYIISEAMCALGIPTTRALAAVTTGEPVLREAAMPGAIVTRVAASHIRVGTFQYFAARRDVEALQALSAHAIARHYPDADGPLGLLQAVIAAQARLVAKWMGVGFIHGVMNTDNMSIAGETIDYGPCAFMDAYHSEKVFSSIDQFGRYAFGNQPNVAVWNLAQLATALLPLMPERDSAIEIFTHEINTFPDLFDLEWHRVLRAKLGLARVEEADVALAFDLLTLMEQAQADFTRYFRGLSGADPAQTAAEFTDPGPFNTWLLRWQTRLDRETRSPAERQSAMEAVNPAFIPRNHRVEEVIKASLSGDYDPFFKLVDILKRPFEDQPENRAYQAAPAPEETVTRTFCGT